MPLQMALETIMSDLENTVQDGEEGPSEDRHQTDRSGRAIVSPIVESTAVSPSDGPCFDDCYPPLPYNPDRDPGSSYWKGVENWTVGCDTNRLHNRVHFAS